MTPENRIICAINTSSLNRGLDGADWLAQPGNVPIVAGDDIALFDHEAAGVFQVHFLFSSRGKAAVASARASFRCMFEDYGADMIFGLVPAFRRDVAMLARWAGGKFVGKRNTAYGPCDLYVLSKEMWSAQ